MRREFSLDKNMKFQSFLCPSVHVLSSVGGGKILNAQLAVDNDFRDRGSSLDGTHSRS